MKPSKIASKAAKWWADTLRTPVQHDAGDGFLNGLVNGMGRFLPRPDEAQIQAFEDLLASKIDGALKERSELYTATDYEPLGVLAETARELGLDLKYRLPVKTRLIIRGTELWAIKGYCAPEKPVG